MNMRNQIWILTITVLLLQPLPSIAGWFGADNYEDCVFEKMKGQNTAMIWTAQKACEKEFPYEKELSSYKDSIEVGLLRDSSRLVLSIEKNFGEYRITKYKASFSIKSCDKIKSDSDYTLTKTFVFTGRETTSSVTVSNASDYKCMREETIWGIWRK